MKKQTPPEVSKHFSHLGKQSWKKRQEKLLLKEKQKVERQSIKNNGLDV